jgi:hypothetical protein
MAHETTSAYTSQGLDGQGMSVGNLAVLFEYLINFFGKKTGFLEYLF